MFDPAVQFLLLGMSVGLITLVPPGPVSMALIQLSARRGPHVALRGALGVAFGDVVLAGVAVAVVGMGSTLPGTAFQAAQAIAAVILIGLGALLWLRPNVAEASIARIERPGRAFFLLTSLTPTALGAWVALLAAMPFAGNRPALVLFAAGVVVASFLWHPLLGATASKIGSRLTATGHTRLARSGATIMMAIGTMLVVPALS